MRKHIQIGKRSLDISTTALRAWNDAKLFKRRNSMYFVWWKLSIEYKSNYDCDACKDATYNGAGESCKECCEHWDRDAHCCLDCGAERDYGGEIDTVEYQFGDR